ncbi:tetratricopeptide repeat protein [Sphingomonas sp. Root710]|uniref:tetratricopeptide repeat protein n=1 Tax=Sphingomonas sp. Root710 TaxID=1736594 RepID=UPI00138F30C0|nr:tetratricopeptide repeat protein [Sphingomonas sp. Root710]
MKSWMASPWARAAALLFIALAIVFAADRWLVPGQPSPPPVERRPSGGAPASYAAMLARDDQIAEGAAMLLRDHRGEWLFEERLANALIARGRLTGSFQDYADAQAALDRAFATAPEGAGPHQTQAALAFTLHRLKQAEAALDAIDHYAVPEAEARIEVAAARGDIAFYRGDYDGALHRYQAASADPDDIAILFRIANFQARTGQPDAALATLDRCERLARLPTAQTLADLALRRGSIELQRGRWDEARRHFDRAARLFPGWWLADAHRAQMLALAGDGPAAILAYQRVIRIARSPEAMDALAALYRDQGEREKSAFWADQARGIWNDRLARFPEASYGHAVEHVLTFGDPKTALVFARRDAANRPYGQALTALAWALIANNDPRGAVAAVGPVNQSKWVSADAHLAAAQAHLLLGESDAAEAEQRAALAINPRAADRRATMIWFGH